MSRDIKMNDKNKYHCVQCGFELQNFYTKLYSSQKEIPIEFEKVFHDSFLKILAHSENKNMIKLPKCPFCNFDMELTKIVGDYFFYCSRGCNKKEKEILKEIYEDKLSSIKAKMELLVGSIS